MSRTLTSPRSHASSSTWRSSFPSASEATSLGRRNPRKRNRGAFMVVAFWAEISVDVNKRGSLDNSRIWVINFGEVGGLRMVENSDPGIPRDLFLAVGNK